MDSSTVVAAGIPALGTMLVIAGVALVLGLGALWLSRRHTHHERRHEREHREHGYQRPPVPPTDPPPPA